MPMGIYRLTKSAVGLTMSRKGKRFCYAQTITGVSISRFMSSKRIVLATFGSLGDVQPMLALALTLKSRAHDVLLAGPPEKHAWATQLGCPFYPMGSNVTGFLDTMKDAHSIPSAFRFIRFLKGEFIDQFCALKKVFSGADLAVGASLAFSVASIAESMEIPYRYVAFTPQLLPSGHHPFLACRRQNFPPWINRMTWRIPRHLERFYLTALLNTQRQELGLGPVRDAWQHILGFKVVVASDSVLARVPPDVKPAFTQTGYLHLSQPHVPLPELELFLSEGPRPVYAGFGSMPKEDQARLTPIIVSAIRSLGKY
jgi:UDP:flavonoid glycosyltransferase YjiC (YdhE family)